MNEHPIRDEWKEYYKTLEAIRESGITNMYGAAPYLASMEGIDEDLAEDVLISWMRNYSELAEMFNWR